MGKESNLRVQALGPLLCHLSYPSFTFPYVRKRHISRQCNELESQSHARTVALLFATGTLFKRLFGCLLWHGNVGCRPHGCSRFIYLSVGSDMARRNWHIRYVLLSQISARAFVALTFRTYGSVAHRRRSSDFRTYGKSTDFRIRKNDRFPYTEKQCFSVYGNALNK